MKILIVGVGGTLGRLLAESLIADGHEVIGIDRRGYPNAPKALDLHILDVRKRGAEDVFRTKKPEAVVHMGTVTSLMMRGEERHRINLGGTRAVFDHAQNHGVAHVIFVGRHTFYGADPDSPLFHTEDEPPVGLATFPELADLVAADLFACTALWRMRQVKTSVLRMVYTLGSTGHGTLASYLRGRRVPTILGYDPLFQFLHETDAVRAIRATLGIRPEGVFNVVGPSPLPLSVLIRETGRTRWPIPEPLLTALLGRFGLPNLPRGALGHIKYPVVVDGSRFRAATGFVHEVDEIAAIADFRAAFPVTSSGHG